MSSTMPLPEECGSFGATCTTVTTQKADVSLSVHLTPSAEIGDVITECCGDPMIAVCRNNACTCGCDIVITQVIKMKIPITYSAFAETKNSTVVCRTSECV